jgi:pimeloyl-ACP methyl ester carboxylesterase
LSHSYGTFVTSKILQLRPEVVDRVCLIDPVCCMTCHPKLTRNFVYRSYQGWPLASKKRFMDWIQLLFSRDLTIADTFCRQLNGMDVNVFAHDFPVPTGGKKHLLVLSGQDPLVPAHLVMKQFKEVVHVDTLLNERHGHGDFLFDSKYLAYLVVDLRTRTEAGSTKAAAPAHRSPGATL